MAEHLTQESHTIDWKEARAVDAHPHYHQRCFLESWHIRLETSIKNKDEFIGSSLLYTHVQSTEVSCLSIDFSYISRSHTVFLSVLYAADEALCGQNVLHSVVIDSATYLLTINLPTLFKLAWSLAWAICANLYLFPHAVYFCTRHTAAG